MAVFNGRSLSLQPRSLYQPRPINARENYSQRNTVKLLILIINSEIYLAGNLDPSNDQTHYGCNDKEGEWE